MTTSFQVHFEWQEQRKNSNSAFQSGLDNDWTIGQDTHIYIRLDINPIWEHKLLYHRSNLIYITQLFFDHQWYVTILSWFFFYHTHVNIFNSKTQRRLLLLKHIGFHIRTPTQFVVKVNMITNSDWTQFCFLTKSLLISGLFERSLILLDLDIQKCASGSRRCVMITMSCTHHLTTQWGSLGLIQQAKLDRGHSVWIVDLVANAFLVDLH